VVCFRREEVAYKAIIASDATGLEISPVVLLYYPKAVTEQLTDRLL
jgi:hypothetical protein